MKLEAINRTVAIISLLLPLDRAEVGVTRRRGQGEDSHRAGPEGGGEQGRNARSAWVKHLGIAWSPQISYFPCAFWGTSRAGFLAAHDSNLVTLGGQAERYFRDDPPTCLIKLRQLAELLTKLVAAHHAVYRGERETFEEINMLDDGGLTPSITVSVCLLLRMFALIGFVRGSSIEQQQRRGWARNSQAAPSGQQRKGAIRSNIVGKRTSCAILTSAGGLIHCYRKAGRVVEQTRPALAATASACLPVPR